MVEANLREHLLSQAARLRLKGNPLRLPDAWYVGAIEAFFGLLDLL